MISRIRNAQFNLREPEILPSATPVRLPYTTVRNRDSVRNMSEARMSSKGQITLPKESGTGSGEAGDRVRFIVEDDGESAATGQAGDLRLSASCEAQATLSIKKWTRSSDRSRRHVLGHDRD